MAVGNSKRKMIFNAVKHELPETFKVVYLNNVVSRVVNGVNVPTINRNSITLKSGPPDEYDNNNELVRRYQLLKMNIYGGPKPEDIDIVEDYCEEIIEKLGVLKNRTYDFNTGRLYVFRIKLDGDINFLNWTNQGIPVYSINFIIEFI